MGSTPKRKRGKRRIELRGLNRGDSPAKREIGQFMGCPKRGCPAQSSRTTQDKKGNGEKEMEEKAVEIAIPHQKIGRKELESVLIHPRERDAVRAA